MQPLKAEQLRRVYKPEDFPVDSEAISGHRKSIIGQERAIRAMRFGLGNRGPGFNVYVSTPDGDSKIPVIRHFLEETLAKDPVPADWCYVNNFQDPYCPKALRLPNGKARQFKADMEDFIRDAKASLVKTFSSDEYAQKLSTIEQEMEQQQQQLFMDLNEQAAKENFVIRRTPVEILAVPVKDGVEMTRQQFLDLDDKEKEVVKGKQRELQNQLQRAIRKGREIERDAAEAIGELEQKVALFAMEDLLEDLLHKYQELPGVPEHLHAVKNDILEHLPLFLREQQDNANPLVSSQNRAYDQRYEVNIIIDNSGLEKAPIVVELNPTYFNLFGRIEREAELGNLITNFTLIRSGVLHKANGGYLILPLDDLLMSPFSWENLKRALRNGQLEIEDPTQKYGMIGGKSLQPGAIALDVQIVLVGRHYLFQLLYQLDDDFKDLFKVKAEFDDVMPSNPENLSEFSGLIHGIGKEEGLLSTSQAAMVQLAEYSHRLAEHQGKLTTRFGLVADLLREANYYALVENASAILPEHVQKAVKEKVYRSDLIDEKIRELVREGVIMVDLEGEKAGQINGLSYMDLGDIAIGRPSRITASVSIGRGNVIDIEREAKLGGPIHAKGVMILTGFLFDYFGQDKPLGLSARIVFEQSYGGVDGDSASSAELYAILSKLADVPIRQAIAVTGSINQRGEIQAIGGVNEKIEGFFEVCRQTGLKNGNGVMIPESNVVNLMLKEEVVEAVRKGQFTIWPVKTVEEGIEILTGMKAGKRTLDPATGQMQFEPGTLFDRVNKRLRFMNEQLKKAMKEEEEA